MGAIRDGFRAATRCDDRILYSSENERDASLSGDISRQFDIVASWFNYAVGCVCRRCAENVDGWSRQGYFWRGGERRRVYIKGTKHPRGFSRYDHAVTAAWLKSLVGGQRIARWRLARSDNYTTCRNSPFERRRNDIAIRPVSP